MAKVFRISAGQCGLETLQLERDFSSPTGTRSRRAEAPYERMKKGSMSEACWCTGTHNQILRKEEIPHAGRRLWKGQVMEEPQS